MSKKRPAYYDDPILFAKNFLKIRDKRGRLIPFTPNETQKRHYRRKQLAKQEGKRPIFLVLKFRRRGMTTWEQAESYHMVATRGYHEAVTLAQDKDSTEKIFRMCNTFYDNHRLPEDFCKRRKVKDPFMIRPKRKYSSKREISFSDSHSVFYIGTAGSSSFGRGQTLNRVHGSEVSRWRGDRESINDMVVGLLEACSHGEVVFETTAKGMGNWFHWIWKGAKNGKNDWIPLFYPWTEDTTDCWRPVKKNEELKYTTLEEELAKKYHLKPEQINFRRHKIKEIGEKMFPQEYPLNDVEAFVVTGICYFDSEKVSSLAKYCLEPVKTMDDGSFTVWKEPVPGRKYFIGGDVGEGVPDGDFSCAKVLDEDMTEVASWHGIIKPENFAKKVAEIGLYYNGAIVGIEANNHGHTVLNVLRNSLYYGNLYYMLDYDRRKGKKVRKLGWQTTGRSRPILLDDFKHSIEGGDTHVNDPGTLEECNSFIDNGTGKYEAPRGEHDDRIFAHGIAIQIRGKPIVWNADVSKAELDLGISRLPVIDVIDRLPIEGDFY
jgi:hypothetical protein